jgi:hypothetical protein
MSVIHKTTQYNQFKKYPQNRPVNSQQVLESIERNNMLHLNPIVVTSDFHVIDGQHRLDAAMKLGVPIYYVIHENGSVEDISPFQQQRAWTLSDFLHYYKDTNRHYHFVAEIVEKYNVRNNIAFVIKACGSGNFPTKSFKNGTYKIKQDKDKIVENFRRLFEVINLLREMGKYEYISVSTLEALYSIVNGTKYNHENFIHKLDTYRDNVLRCLKFREMRTIKENFIELVYNFKAKFDKNRMDVNEV